MNDSPVQKTASTSEQLSLMASSVATEFFKPVAICTLTDDDLRDILLADKRSQGILVGSLHTENIGIEHLISYVLDNPHTRFIIVCGKDGTQAIGHLPGQTFISLSENGMDEHGKIIGAQGKRPVIQNVSTEGVKHFRKYTKVVNLMETTDPEVIFETAQQCISQNPGPAETFHEAEKAQKVETIEGYEPSKMVSDPAGYFVITVDHIEGVIRLEHYQNDGVKNLVVQGRYAAELYFPVIERNLISLLDHAAYLGRELYRAEQALKKNIEYVQDDLANS